MAADMRLSSYNCIRVPAKTLIALMLKGVIGVNGDQELQKSQVKKYAKKLRTKKDQGGLLEAIIASCFLKRPLFVWAGSLSSRPLYMFFPDMRCTAPAPPIGLVHNCEAPVGHWDALWMTNEINSSKRTHEDILRDVMSGISIKTISTNVTKIAMV
eukprot:CAMPEP_0114504264 /NCGR_PEP_ID=MMETSP0109-20121206/10112_1 /TAXON_ID=29199 /ORGANISM="Chlorarachnion reptans, Strain CCCM449" /LENGTH=155 /DNA_ID=CAMNT_0001682395 /DNA_START=579 /DNA_END=1046 /DNA_ORIENTATION=-